MKQEILQYLSDRSTKELQSSQNEIEKQKRYQNALQYNLEILKSKLPILEASLNKMGLEIAEVLYSMNDELRLSVSISAKPNSDKFKFIAFQGYTSRGAGKNRERLDAKASKIAQQLKDISGLPVGVNCYSLEIRKPGDENKSVLIGLYIQ